MSYIDEVQVGGTDYDIYAKALSGGASIDGVDFDATGNVTHYAVCSTAEGTAAKTATLGTNFTLSAGSRVEIKFTYGNTAASPTLNINSTGAVAIKSYGTTAAGSGAWVAGQIVQFEYDGTNWLIVGRVPVDTTLTQSGQAADSAAVGESIDSIVNVKVRSVVATFRQGFGIGSNGDWFSSPKRIATVGSPINISTAKRLLYDITDGYRIYIATYSTAEATSTSKVSTYGWLSGNGGITTGDTELYCRVCIASDGDETQCTPSDADKAAITFTTQLYYDLLDGLVYRRWIAQTEDLDDLIDRGIYAISNYSPQGIAHVPTGFTGGTLMVTYGYSALSTIAEPFAMLLQVLLSPVNGAIWMRYRSSSGTWNAWATIAGSVIATQTKWLAVGDSITYGVYSFDNNGTPASSVTKNSWVRLLSDARKYDITVMASRGMGYSASVTGQDPIDSSQPRITLDTLLTRIEALTDDYNLVTLAFGINDYATSSATIATMTEGLTDAIERLATKFPESRLVVITPFNSSREGSASTQWAYNSAINGRTLKDMSDAIAHVCADYGVECINATNGFLLNTVNIRTLLPDNTHPSLVGHQLIAKNMAHYLTF